MGLDRISIAAVIALLAVPALHAQTEPQPASTEPAAAAAAPDTQAPTSDPALQASPIGDSAPATVQPAAPEATPATPVTSTPAETKGDTLTLPKEKAAAPRKKTVRSAPIRIEVDGMPGRGASMSQVEKRFGQPREKIAPVGNPPITRWAYDDYTVYFEHEYVIHSVRNDGTAPSAPAPATSQPAPQQPIAPATETTSAPAEPVTPASQPPMEPEAPATEPAVPAMPETAAPPTAAPAPAVPASGQ